MHRRRFDARGRERRDRAARGHVLALLAVLIATLAGVAPIAGARAAATAPVDWPAYHGGGSGSGVASGVRPIDTGARAWTSPVLDGQLFGQPVVSSGIVFVATENDTVDALSAATGAVVWSRHLATPVPASAVPCGDIAPTVGITGTPVVDPARGELYVVADELQGGHPAHILVGLSTATGEIERTVVVDPPGADPAALLQRTGLTLDDGRVIFGMGGNYGDCGSYRGRVVAVGEAGGAPAYFTVDAAADQRQGAVWMGGAAPVIDAHGNVWVSAGNGSVTSAAQGYDDSDSALELTPSMHLVAYFAPTSWPADNATDRDMSIAPALLADGQVVLAGKSGIAYLLDGSRPGGIGGQVATLPGACGADIDGGTAVFGTTVVLPCVTGPVAVRTNAAPSRLAVRWRAAVGGGPPIAAAGLVWTIGLDGVLYGLDPATGAIRRQVAVGTVANHFPTPGFGAGLLLVPTAAQVVAFRAVAAPTPAGTATAPARPPTATSAPTGGGGGSAGRPAWAWGLLAAAAVVLAGVVGAAAWRRH